MTSKSLLANVYDNANAWPQSHLMVSDDATDDDGTHLSQICLFILVLNNPLGFCRISCKLVHQMTENQRLG